MKNTVVFRKCLMIYIHRCRPDIKLELEDIINMQELQAINKKVEELGWID